MKKIFAFMLCLIMVLSLCACKGDEPASDNEYEYVPAETEAPEPVTDFDFGSVYGKSYSNETMGIGISLTEDFIVTTNSKLAEMNGMDEELMTTNLPEAMEKAEKEQAYIFIAADNAGSYMNIIAENLNLTGKEFMLGDEYFDANKDKTQKEIEDMGGTNITFTDSKITIAGTTYTAQIINYNLDEYSESETRIAFPCGKYMAVMTIKGDTSLIINRTYGLAQ